MNSFFTNCLRLGALLCLLAAGPMLLATSQRTRTSELSLHDMSGKRVRLQDHRGRIVVLNFWATWCSSCTEEMPMLVEAEKEYGARGVIFIGAAVDERKTRRNVPEF